MDSYGYGIFIWMNSFLGIVGNSLSSVVLFQLSKISSFYLYLTFLALSDMSLSICDAITNLLDFTKLENYKIDVKWLCSAEFALALIFSHLSSWITVAVTFDRYVAVCHPLNAIKYCTRRRALIYICTVFLVIVAVNFPIICFKWDEEGSSCVIPEFTNDYCFKYSIYIDTCSYVLIPFCLICALNTLTIQGIYKAARRRHNLTANSGNVSSSIANMKDSTRRSITMLFTVTTFFIVTFLPFVFISVYGMIYSENLVAIQELIPVADTIAYVATQLNHSLNFIMYGLSGKRFRDKFLETFCCRRNVRRSQNK
ncbi:FMRFamide receptor [Mizuhopecten yessoensis]|uniref:FMRFamide receptor n=1 Tax=Mizuhopecten yessoensis TaxID=6573 RepID=A0A210Q175_MIZYE|nr:FMRFamide receptor [Mizuhopecten yessoensis]